MTYIVSEANANGHSPANESVVRTYRFRLRDKHAKRLAIQAKSVNIVWNYCNDTQQKAARSLRRWLSYVDLARLTSGSSAELDLHSHTVQCVCRAYEKARKHHKKPWLRWRGVKSLGWVPFNTGHVTFDGQSFVFRGVRYQAMHARGLVPGLKIGAGSFNSDSRGRWYINVPVEIPVEMRPPVKAVGIDLGLKTLATLSDGSKIEMPGFYRASEETLATAQKRRKTRRAKALHAKIANRRKDFLHKASRKVADEFGLIVVGNMSPSTLARTRMAKSTLDAGWSAFRKMLEYKAITRSSIYLEVSEANTTQTCSECGSMPPSRPKGITGLSKRMWRCDDCGTAHDRDVNAARNILRVGQHTLSEGALV